VLAINPYQQASSGLKIFQEGIPGSHTILVDCQQVLIDILAKKMPRVINIPMA